MSTQSFQHLGIVSGAAREGGRAAVTELMLANPVLSLGAGIQNLSKAGECFIVHSWAALGTIWQGSLVPTKAAQAARLVSSCVLGDAHL